VDRADEAWENSASQRRPRPHLGVPVCGQHPPGTGVSTSRSVPIPGRRVRQPRRAPKRPPLMVWWPQCWRAASQRPWGSIAYRCLPCGQGQPLVSRRWHSSRCVRYAQVSPAHWVRQVSTVLPAGGIERHLILPVPAMVRPTCDHNAAGVWSALRRCGAPCVADGSSTVQGKALQGGALPVLHTQGRSGPYPGSALGASPVSPRGAPPPAGAGVSAADAPPDAPDGRGPAVGRCVLPALSRRAGAQRATGPRPRAGAQGGTRHGHLGGASTQRHPAQRALRGRASDGACPLPPHRQEGGRTAPGRHGSGPPGAAHEAQRRAAPPVGRGPGRQDGGQGAGGEARGLGQGHGGGPGRRQAPRPLPLSAAIGAKDGARSRPVSPRSERAGTVGHLAPAFWSDL